VSPNQQALKAAVDAYLNAEALHANCDAALDALTAALNELLDQDRP
jgi:hypothetical protein